MADTRFKSRYIVQCALFFFVAVLLLWSASYALYHFRSCRAVQEIQSRAESNLKIIRALMLAELSDAVSDLLYLAGTSEADDAFTSIMSADHLADLTLFAEVKKNYDQIRFIDRYGMEAVRINYNKGKPSVVPDSRLQFKGNRYYFTKVVDLDKNAIYLSPLDLNKERGAVERPLKPMLRLGTPLFDDQGKRRGVALLNYFGKRLLSAFDHSLPISGEMLYLVNEDGYLLVGPNPEDNWGFMFEDKKDKTFQARFPKEWKQVKSHRNGKISSESGLFNYAELCLDRLEHSPNIKIFSDAGCLKIISHVPDKALSAPTRDLFKNIFIFDVVLTFILGPVCFLICRLRLSNARAHISMDEKTASYERFVPREFLGLMEKERYRDVTLESNVRKSMGILFSDIRSYTSLSESMEPEEVLDFLNTYFADINPAISDNNGFVDSFHGDALLALFPDSPEMAVHAAVDMLRMLEQFNLRREKSGHDPVSIGIGVHFGEVTLGTVGTSGRMQATVIGDAVNLASRIESATKTFKADIVLTESVYNLLPDPDFFHLREIDTVRVKGKKEPVILYELFDTDPDKIKKAKLQSKADMDHALALYKKGDFQQALEIFNKCAEACPEDNIPAIYIKRCSTFLRMPPGPGWAGVSPI